MPRRRLLGAGLAAAVAVPVLGWAGTATAREDAAATIRSGAEKLCRDGVPGLVYAARSTDWRAVEAVGVADMDSGRPMREHYRSRMASISKTFTAVGVLRLVADGLVDVDTLADDYLPGVIDGDRAKRITVRMLLNHTTGIGDYGGVYFEGDSREAVERLRWSRAEPQDSARVGLEQPATNEPGEKFDYSNTNYVLLGMIITSVTGVDAEEWLNREVIRAAGLRDTYFPGTAMRIKGPHSKAYHRFPDGDLGEYSVFRMRWDSTAGSLIATPADVGAFYRALLRGELLPSAQLKQLKTLVPAPDEDHGYGMGLGALKLPGKGLAWFHGGGNPGVHTGAWVSDDGKRSFVYSFNMTGVAYEAIEAWQQDAMRRVLFP